MHRPWHLQETLLHVPLRTVSNVVALLAGARGGGLDNPQTLVPYFTARLEYNLLWYSKYPSPSQHPSIGDLGAKQSIHLTG